MVDIDVTELRHNLLAYLAKVRRGARVSVTSHGKVIAGIVPPSADKATKAAARARPTASVDLCERRLAPALAADEWDMNR